MHGTVGNSVCFGNLMNTGTVWKEPKQYLFHFYSEWFSFKDDTNIYSENDYLELGIETFRNWKC